MLLQLIPSLKTYDHPEDDPDYREPSLEEGRRAYLLDAGVTDLDNTFDKMRVPPGFSDTLAAFKALAEGKGKPILMVYGPAGNGKSKCCEALVIALYSRGIRARREKWSDIIRFTLKATFNRKHPEEGPSYEQAFRVLREKKYLIIDDIGMGSTGGNWEWGELEDIVDYRLEHKLFTVLTTNLDIKDMPPRIISRLRDKSRCTLIHNKSADQRPLGGK